MKLINFLLLMSIAMSMAAQGYVQSNAIVRNYNMNKQKHGPWVFFDSTNMQLGYALFSNDSLEEIYYACGKGIRESYRFYQYKDGRLWNVFYKFDCGNLFPSIGSFQNGNGILYDYMTITDTGCYVLYSATTYKKGLPNGQEKYFNHQGNVISEGFVIPADTVDLHYTRTTISPFNDTIVDYYFSNQHGIKDGWWKYYTDAGILAFEAYYEKDELKEVLDYETKKSKLSGSGLAYYKSKRKAVRVTDDFGLSHFKDVIAYWF